MRKSLVVVALVASLSSLSMAKPNMQMNPDALKKMQAMAGDKSPYYRAKKRFSLKITF